MVALSYKCTSCKLPFVGIASLAAHIAVMHQHVLVEDELDQVRRRAQILEDDDEDEDLDDSDDFELPHRPDELRDHLERIRRYAAVGIAERNHARLERAHEELDKLQTHCAILAGAVAAIEKECAATRESVRWVLTSATDESL